jgi:hypothetical protein
LSSPIDTSPQKQRKTLLGMKQTRGVEVR